MVVTSEEPTGESLTYTSPLLIERTENCQSNEHVINIEQGGDPSSSDSSDSESPRGLSSSRHDDRPSARNSPSTSSNGSNSQSPSVARRGEGFGRHWSPFNTVLWISIELVFTLGQITAVVVVLSVSGQENPQTPLFAWVSGYALRCAASLHLLYWRYLHGNQAAERRSAQFRQGSRRVNSSFDPNSYITFSLTRSSEDEVEN
ncbi:PREDICTED: uncharacterized protein LOC109174396 [Ipomoea nil]|uniref:uncharacterized protein LOC109174396 n=1 Tax=Ipomoea nil TaxID=35883 RepID=UPI00090200F5|nr:PREDICTED: uncharacterized protein LOC109174396 [Ipomoea nil]